jgi:probable HAF family extracellular repeat protein
VVRRKLLLGSCLTLLACHSFSSAPTPEKTSTPLVTSITLSDLGAGTSWSHAYGISNDGVIGGERRVDGQDHATRWVNGVATDIHPAGALSSIIGSVNGAGDMAGVVAHEPNLPGTYWKGRLALWPAGSATPTEIPIDASYGQVFLNSSRQIAATHPGAESGAFVWSERAGVREIGTFGGVGSLPTAMNEIGVVVGFASTALGYWHAFRWRDGTTTDLGTLVGPAGESRAHAVNDALVVVGVSTSSSGVGHAVEWVDGNIIDLDPSGTERSVALGVNNAGHIVGYRTIAGSFHATLWRDGQMIDLGAGDASSARLITEDDVIAGVRNWGVGWLWHDRAQGPIDLPLPADQPAGAPWVIASGAALGFTFNLDLTSVRAASWTFTVASPPTNEQIDHLEGAVTDLQATGAVTPGISQSLRSKLDGAARQCERGNANAARSQIRAFINHVNALVESGTLTAAQGAALVSEAEAILGSLACGGG